MSEYPLKKYYIKYMKDVRKLSESSIRHYLDAINWISRYLVDKGLLKTILYEIYDVDELKTLSKILYDDELFVSMNKRGHQMYSAGFNNYLRFASGEEFEKVGQQISIMDIPIPIIVQMENSSNNTWKRSGIIKNQSIISAHYECEVNSKHKTFLTEKNQKMYMEGHHAIPLKMQRSFNTSLDVYANIICLCPVCHRLLHYGRKEDKLPSLNKIYYERSKRLANSGIQIGHDDFLEIVL